MTKENTTPKSETQLPARMSQATMAMARKVDEIAGGAMALFAEAGSFESELSVALAVNDLRVALTPEILAPVMALMNTDLGFRTDRDPKLTPKDKDGNPMTPYTMEVVRECFIESKLRGFHACGNEWNIISGRFYACRNGLKRKCEQWPGLTDLKVDFGVPKLSGDKGAVVPVEARWRREGIADSIKAEIPVRVNYGMGADAIIGKAERKIYKRIHDRLSGVVTPEGEATEELEVQPGAKPTPRFDKSQSQDAEVVEQPKTNAATPQDQLAEIVTSTGHSFDDFIGWAKNTGSMTPAELDGVTGFGDLGEERAKRFVNAKAGLLRGLAGTKGGAK